MLKELEVLLDVQLAVGEGGQVLAGLVLFHAIVGHGVVHLLESNP